MVEALREARRRLVCMDDDGDVMCMGCQCWEDNCAEPDRTGARIEHDPECATPVIDAALAAWESRGPMRDISLCRQAVMSFGSFTMEDVTGILDAVDQALTGRGET